MDKPTHYLCKTGHCLSCKNKLEAAFVEYLKGLNGNLVLSVEIEKLKYKIKAKSIELNKAYNRCKPLKIEFYRMRTDLHFSISFYTIDFKIFDAFLISEGK